jgi:subtilisin family serine protease
MAEPDDLDQHERREHFTRQWANYRVSPDLLAQAAQVPGKRVSAIVELNVDYPGGLDVAREAANGKLRDARGVRDPEPDENEVLSRHHLFVDLTWEELAALDGAPEVDADNRPIAHPIYKIFADDVLRPLATFSSVSIRTIKAEACLTTFRTDGENIVVAVADSGIDGRHRHFKKHKNLELPDGIQHRDFTGATLVKGDDALVDPFGHGTHVAGIIAGQLDAEAGEIIRLRDWREAQITAGVENPDLASIRQVAEANDERVSLRGVAPKTKLLCLRVLDDNGEGRASRLIAALDYIHQLNDSGRKLKVHCLNLSLGYPFDARWYAAGQSPLCVVVNRLVRSGVAVVIAAGNDGSVMLSSEASAAAKRFSLDQSINDPGNAEEAITVGSTHGESPHLYGVSYFSSRGPTADGREKPDLLAPGERILSCAVGATTRKALDDADTAAVDGKVYYREESGTSMACAHVAGAVAAFLSIQGEFINEPQRLKKVLMASCTDLGRKRDFQGAGLIDLMRAVQSV